MVCAAHTAQKHLIKSLRMVTGRGLSVWMSAPVLVVGLIIHNVSHLHPCSMDANVHLSGPYFMSSVWFSLLQGDMLLGFSLMRYQEPNQDQPDGASRNAPV